MVKYEIDEKHFLLKVYPTAPLSEKDFAALNSAVNSLIEKNGLITGIIIISENFPGWESLGAMGSHFKFIKDNHKKINKIALVTDTKLANIAQALVSHFVAAEIKKFPAGNEEQATKWITGKE